ncbi:MAG: UvrD-helicase domain-containing protein [Alphaproteobacteria bacterium]|jgi:DNA helicase-2/ATP-dependent DNA helicase PcrA|nr:UvrD-helicase domain-containing protein [Alphaproteobacteria bacterium]
MERHELAGMIDHTLLKPEATDRQVEQLCREAAGGAPLPAAVVDWAGTFHAVGARLLRLHADRIGLAPDFTILDRGDAEDLLDLVRDDLDLGRTAKRFPRKATCLAIYSYAVNARMTDRLDDVLATAFPWCGEWAAELKRLFGAYVAAKQARGTLDYDDILLYWAQMMQVDGVAEPVRARFDHILVDEYQDTNRLQADILAGLKPDGAGLTVVGDDAQSIYAFRAATVRNILDFPDRFDPPARIVTLDRNYRSTAPILGACNAVIGHAAERFTKDLRTDRTGGARPVLATVEDERGQVDYVVDRVLEAYEAGVPLKDQAVLARAAFHTGPLEIELTRRNVPFVKFGGLKFLEAAHVKDLISILRWAENPKDPVAAFRTLRLMPGVGAATARKAMARMEGAGWAFSGLLDFRPPPAAAQAWPELVATMTALGSSLWAGQIGRARAWYDPLMETLYDNARVRRGDLEQLERIAANYPGRTRFLTEVALDPPETTGDEAGVPLLDEDYLILSTIHSAKGQEWHTVFVLNCVDGCIPSDLATGTADEIEEERRLLYVAMTRAKDALHLMHPLRFYTRSQHRHGDAHIMAPRSRFLPDDVLDRFDRRGPARPLADDPPATAGTARVDLKVAMRDLFG